MRAITILVLVAVTSLISMQQVSAMRAGEPHPDDHVWQRAKQVLHGIEQGVLKPGDDVVFNPHMR
jgi:hypothetical protein